MTSHVGIELNGRFVASAEAQPLAEWHKVEGIERGCTILENSARGGSHPAS
jgi:hypothetical protein